MAELMPVNVYVCANVLLVLAAALVESIRVVSSVLRQPMAYRHQLRLSQAAALAALLLPIFSAFSGRPGLLPKTAQIWSAPTTVEGTLPGLRRGIPLGAAAPEWTAARAPGSAARGGRLSQ
jgi:hypothetical protein